METDRWKDAGGMMVKEPFAPSQIRGGKDALDEEGVCISCGAKRQRPHRPQCQNAQECDQFGR